MISGKEKKNKIKATNNQMQTDDAGEGWGTGT